MAGKILGFPKETAYIIVGAIILCLIGVTCCIVGWCCWRRRKQNLQAGQSMKTTLEELHRVRSKKSEQSLMIPEKNGRSNSNVTAGGEATTQMSTAVAARPGVDKTQSVQAYTPPIANSTNVNGASVSVEDSNINDKNNDGQKKK